MVPVKTIGLMSETSFDGRRCQRSPRPTASRLAALARVFIAPIRDPNASCCDRRSPTLSARRPKGAPRGPLRSRTAGHRGARGDGRMLVPGAALRSHPNRNHQVPRSDRAAPACLGTDGPDWRRTRVGTAAREPVAHDFRAADMAAGGQGVAGANIPSALATTLNRPFFAQPPRKFAGLDLSAMTVGDGPRH